MYLGFQGYKTAKSPSCAASSPPGSCSRSSAHAIVGLTIEAGGLRRSAAGASAPAGAHSRDGYAELNRIHEELEQASALQRRLVCPVLDVSNLAVEEAACA